MNTVDVSLQLSLGTCKPWHTVEATNSESQLPYICEDEYMPASSLHSVFSGTVPATKPRNGTADHEFEGLWYEFVVELQEEYCHAGGTLLVFFSELSDTSIFTNLTTSPVDDTLQAVLTQSAADAAAGAGWSSLQREEVPVLRGRGPLSPPRRLRKRRVTRSQSVSPYT